MANLSEKIDSLLEHYLQLLDTYTTLKSELGRTQSSIYQHIARANFSADRGHRYGQDSYDERMQASRLCNITSQHNNEDAPPSSVPVFTTTLKPIEDHATIKKDGPEGEAESTGQDIDIGTENEQSSSTPAPPKRKDPLRMFGILVPQPLRMAQSESIHAVEDLIPKLVSLDAEMKEVEIEIRRARKRRAKAEALEEKEKTKMDQDSRAEIAA
ncbi:hypothetical protein F5884DRAFT_515347 [Xylogone sp. PMI_703]|nr:hypothetical protein F5884DRAFT_515347 [Xylogone sp. PMI_703]